MAASCLDDENEIPCKVCDSFSAVNSLDSYPHSGNICLLVHVLTIRISPCLSYMLTYAFLDVFIQS